MGSNKVGECKILENKDKNKQNAVSFENLKKLSGLISGSELSSLASYISKSKTALDTFCKKLKEHEVALKKAEANKVIVVEPKVEPKMEGIIILKMYTRFCKESLMVMLKCV